MSSERTATEQLDRFARLGLRTQLLEELIDVDTIDDAHRVAAQADGTAFAAQLNRTPHVAWAG